MADVKEGKIAKTDLKAASADEGLVGSWVSHSAELAERTAGTVFGIVRDVRGAVNERLLGTLAFVESTQQGVFKLLRTVDERVDKLTGDAIDAAEGVTLGLIRTLGDTGHGVTDLAGNLTRPREASRAA
jgi:hypothetical protein